MSQQQIPLLFLGDSPSLPTGLGRIGRDLALLASRLPQFRVAYLGRGGGAHVNTGIADSRLPFMQYTYQPTMNDQWGATVLPDVWRNWARGDRGAIFTVWDPSRLTHFGNPHSLDPAHDPWYLFATSSEYEKWGYFAIDAEGPGRVGALPHMLAATMRGYDRVLAYSRFGRQIIEASFDHVLDDPHPDVDWLPHGYNGSVFYPRGRAAPDAVRVGCVMSNQPRKDWGVWAQMAALIAANDPNVQFWAHTDSLDAHWDLRTLVDTFGLVGRTIITTDQPSDPEMALRYSACDVVVLPSLGEGFGYPIVEAQACGVPVLHTKYAGGAELLPIDQLILPDGFRIDTRHCLRRPVLDASAWAERVGYWLVRRDLPGIHQQRVANLEWKKLAPLWERWLVAGAERLVAARGER